MKRTRLSLAGGLLFPILLLFSGCLSDQSPVGVSPSDQTDTFGSNDIDLARGGHGGGGGGGCGVQTAVGIAAVDIQSPMRIHITGRTGLSNGVTIYPKWYEVMADNGTITYVPSGIYMGDPANLLRASVEGLKGGQHYRITARYNDACGGAAYSAPVDVTMPPLVSETIAPSVSGPYYRIGALFSPTPLIEVVASDNTAIAYVQFYFNGVLRNVIDFRPDRIRGWLDVQTPTFQWWIPTELRGLTGTVRVSVIDYLGNGRSVSGTFTL